MIRAFDRLKDGHRERLIGIIDRGEFSPENERYIVSVCMEHGTIEATNAEIRRHLARARDSLGRFNESRARTMLGNVVDDLVAYADRQVDNFADYIDESTTG
jgi:geranylgeranyl pyrophosphate synthase